MHSLSFADNQLHVGGRMLWLDHTTPAETSDCCNVVHERQPAQSNSFKNPDQQLQEAWLWTAQTDPPEQRGESPPISSRKISLLWSSFSSATNPSAAPPVTVTAADPEPCRLDPVATGAGMGATGPPEPPAAPAVKLPPPDTPPAAGGRTADGLPWPYIARRPPMTVPVVVRPAPIWQLKTMGES